MGSSAFATLSGGTSGPHVHFEVKEQGVLESPRDDNGAIYWGYTPDLPDGYGYSDPFLYLYPPASSASLPLTALRIVDEEGGSTTTNRGIRVYSGPGINYSVLGWTGLGQLFSS